MPLVDITLKPGYSMPMLGMRDPNVAAAADITRTMVKFHFARALPNLLVDYAEDLGLDPNTQAEGIQVMRHDYDEDDINAADIWVKFQFSEERPVEDERKRIRDRLYTLILEWFYDMEFGPDGLVIDLFWGPTNGRGSVGGVKIEW